MEEEKKEKKNSSMQVSSEINHRLALDSVGILWRH
jgi:hypothetical protein